MQVKTEDGQPDPHNVFIIDTSRVGVSNYGLYNLLLKASKSPDSVIYGICHDIVKNIILISDELDMGKWEITIKCKFDTINIRSIIGQIYGLENPKMPSNLDTVSPSCWTTLENYKTKIPQIIVHENPSVERVHKTEICKPKEQITLLEESSQSLDSQFFKHMMKCFREFPLSKLKFDSEINDLSKDSQILSPCENKKILNVIKHSPSLDSSWDRYLYLYKLTLICSDSRSAADSIALQLVNEHSTKIQTTIIEYFDPVPTSVNLCSGEDGDETAASELGNIEYDDGLMEKVD